MSSDDARILVTTQLDAASLHLLRAVVRVDYRPGLPPADVEARIGGYQALIVDSASRVSGRTIEYGYRLAALVVLGASLANVSVSAARAQGLAVLNVPAALTLARAEQTLEALLSLAHARGTALAGSTLGIIGLGATGQEVLHRARAFDMQILVHQPRLTSELALEPDVELLELNELLERSDFISLHLPQGAETRHVIGAAQLERCRAHAVLLNTGSAEVVNLDALRAALASGRLAQAAVRLLAGANTAAHPNLKVLPAPFSTASVPPRHAVERVLKQLLELLRQRQPAGAALSLKVVALEDVVPHENFDAARAADLAVRLATESVLVNPPVTAQADGRYVVLDGATRTKAFQQLGYPHIVVQVVRSDDPSLRLHTWYHAVSGVAQPELLALLGAVRAVHIEPAASSAMQAALDSRAALCNLTGADGQGYLVRAAGGHSALQALNALVAAYSAAGAVTRTLNTHLDSLRSEVPGVALLVVFPQFQVAEVLRAALTGELLPAGITRFVIPGRILRLNADLAMLKSGEPLAHKSAWLEQMVAEKLARRNVRFYQEPVTLLDE